MSLQQTVAISCPWCGERNELLIDNSIAQQEYIEDCSVCCRPMLVRVDISVGESAAVTVSRED